MQTARQISPDIYWVGANDRRLERFENIFPLPNGVTYNSFLIMDEKIALLDTVDRTVTRQLIDNIGGILGGKELDYLVVHHMEPDHCAEIEFLCRRFPNMKVVGNAKTLQMIGQFFDFDVSGQFFTVQEGDTLSLGKHTLQFYFAPMVHWPEVMFSYETSHKILFSADAFGTFGAFAGNLFADEVDFGDVFLGEARRYYGNIVGKYGSQVQAALKKLNGVDIEMICPLHGPLWRKNLPYLLDKYDRWSRYVPETNGVLIAYGSMYGNTEKVANIAAAKLAENGITNIRMHDVSKTHPSYIIADVFRYSHILLAAPTYNMQLYLPMETLMHDMHALSLQNRKVALIGNGTWAPVSHEIMKKNLARMNKMEVIGEPFVIRSSFKDAQNEELSALINAVCSSLQTPCEA